MKAFIGALICTAVITVAAAYILQTQQQPASVAFSTVGARVGNPGHNLIGAN